MNIMVFNVAAETVGALSILNDFYNEAKKYRNIKWTFVVSKPYLEEIDNIRVLRFPWVKKSWWHRLFFDNVIAPKLIKKYKINKVFSLQNVIIPHTKTKQILYLHNSLPFIDYRFSFIENKHLWIYQNIIGKSIVKSIKKAEKVIVQTEWMKKACIEKSGVESDKIDVVPPKINVEIKQYFKPNEKSLSTFFYPASEFTYKNHKVIVEACKKLKNQVMKDFKIIFTLKGNENDYITSLHKEVRKHKLPIDFIGNITREQVFSLYTESVLLFPSYIESSPLPLTEAKLHKSIILASDCPFSHEILDGYENAYFFKPFNVDELTDLIKKILFKKIYYINCNPNKDAVNSKNIMSALSFL